MNCLIHNRELNNTQSHHIIIIIIVQKLGRNFARVLWGKQPILFFFFLESLLSSWRLLIYFLTRNLRFLSKCQGTADPLDKMIICHPLPHLSWQRGIAFTLVEELFSQKRLFLSFPLRQIPLSGLLPHSRPQCRLEQTQKSHHWIPCLANHGKIMNSWMNFMR